MQYNPSFDKVEDNLNLTRLRAAEITEAINDAAQRAFEAKQGTFSLNEWVPGFAEAIDTPEAGFYAGFTIGQQVGQAQAFRQAAEAVEAQASKQASPFEDAQVPAAEVPTPSYPESH